MKLPVIVGLAIVMIAAQASAGKKVKIKTEKDKISYSIGVNIGNNLKKQSIEAKADVIAQGIKDALSGKKTLMTEQEMKATMAAFNKDMQAKQQKKMKELGGRNTKEGAAFLAKNKKKKGVKTKKSGLQYKVIKKGKGKKPAASDTVEVHYRGTLIDGTEFDSSHKRGKPATFQVNRVVPGWTEALQLMKVGSKWQLFIPSNLAYGPRGAGGKIGPNATLIFEVELLSIKAAEKAMTKPKPKSK